LIKHIFVWVRRPQGAIRLVVEATGAFATTARSLKVRYPGSLQRICADVRRRTGLLGHLSGDR
jgi:hypothetical protein